MVIFCACIFWLRVVLVDCTRVVFPCTRTNYFSGCLCRRIVVCTYVCRLNRGVPVQLEEKGGEGPSYRSNMYFFTRTISPPPRVRVPVLSTCVELDRPATFRAATAVETTLTTRTNASVEFWFTSLSYFYFEARGRRVEECNIHAIRESGGNELDQVT